MSSGANGRISSASGVGAAVAADDPRLERDRHDGRLEPRVQPDDLARLDEQAGLLPGLADGRLVDGLVDLEEAAGLRPRALRPGSMPRRSSTISPVVGDREDRHDEARVDVGDVAARRAGQAIAVLAGDLAERAARAPQFEQNLRLEASHGGTPPTGRQVGRAAVRPAIEVVHAGSRSREQHERRRDHERRQADDADDDPREPEQALAAIDGHPGPGRAPDPQRRRRRS